MQELQTQFSEQRSKLQAERDTIQAEFERVKSDLLARCKQAEDEVGTIAKSCLLLKTCRKVLDLDLCGGGGWGEVEELLCCSCYNNYNNNLSIYTVACPETILSAHAHTHACIHTNKHN